MTTPDHTPSRACYLRGCRDKDCELANYRYKKRLHLEHARGQRRLRDATQARVHVERLTAAGWTQVQIGDASGIPHESIHKIYTGAQSRIANWRAAAILAIEITDPPTDASRTDATGSRRRLRALRVLGHSRADLAARLGVPPDRIKCITSSSTALVPVTEADAISRLYRRLSTVPGSCRQSATMARNMGWHGPLAWDDIDNPDCKPETATGRERPGLARPDVDPRRVVHLTGEGLSAAQIADRLGCHKRTVVRARRKAEELGVAA